MFLRNWVARSKFDSTLKVIDGGAKVMLALQQKAERKMGGCKLRVNVNGTPKGVRSLVQISSFLQQSPKAEMGLRKVRLDRNALATALDCPIGVSQPFKKQCETIVHRRLRRKPIGQFPVDPQGLLEIALPFKNAAQIQVRSVQVGPSLYRGTKCLGSPGQIPFSHQRITTLGKLLEKESHALDFVQKRVWDARRSFWQLSRLLLLAACRFHIAENVTDACQLDMSLAAERKQPRRSLEVLSSRLVVAARERDPPHSHVGLRAVGNQLGRTTELMLRLVGTIQTH